MESKSKMLTKVTGALYAQEEDAILTWTKDLRNLNQKQEVKLATKLILAQMTELRYRKERNHVSPFHQ
jgi:hypothetical protein